MAGHWLAATALIIFVIGTSAEMACTDMPEGACAAAAAMGGDAFSALQSAKRVAKEIQEHRPWKVANAIVRRIDAAVKEVPLPSQDLIDATGGGDGHKSGGSNLAYVLALTGLREDSKVLELGCGFGRNARWLTQFLNASGVYDGFDIMPDLISWGRANINHRYPNFRLSLAKVMNKFFMKPTSSRKIYVHAGEAAERVDASNYRFPYADGEKDVVFNPSVFTHILRDGVENYVRETYRVLRPGGKALFWFFLLDPAAEKALRKGTNEGYPQLTASEYDNVSWAYSSDPEHMVVYKLPYLKEMLSRVGFVSIKTVFGHWRGIQKSGLPPSLRSNWTDAPSAFQDFVLCEKPL